MLRLDLKREPFWLDLGHGVRLKVRPCTTAVMMAARAAAARAALEDCDNETGTRTAALLSALARCAALEWDDVGDDQGNPAPLTAEGVDALLSLWPMAEAFERLYLAPALLLESEKTPDGPLPLALRRRARVLRRVPARMRCVSLPRAPDAVGRGVGGLGPDAESRGAAACLGRCRRRAGLWCLPRLGGCARLRFSKHGRPLAGGRSGTRRRAQSAIGESGRARARDEDRITAAFKAGTIYFVLAFIAGFALGTLRVLLLVPKIGETIAVLIETPVMLAISWVLCGWLVDIFAVPRGWNSRLTMGITALALLLLAELAVSHFAFGRSLVDHVEAYRTSSGAIGLAAQLLFAAMPLLRRAPGIRH